MSASFFRQPPPALGVLAVLVLLATLLGREASVSEDLPVFFQPQQGIIHVELAGDEVVSGVYQFNDGLSPIDVILLTHALTLDPLPADPVWTRPLCNGERLRISKNDHKIASVHREWMSASHRLTLGIPLHPDRMTLADWPALPGVGAGLAERIENHRQKNGDFGSLEALGKVKGIGEKRLDAWRKFF